MIQKSYYLLTNGGQQFVYSGRILKLRVGGTKRDLIQDASSEEICVVIPGIIARFDGSDISVIDILCFKALRAVIDISFLECSFYS